MVLFVVKDTSLLKNLGNKTNNQAGLTYSTTTIAELVSKDTDGDGIPDWEEVLYGLDPTKKETTAGIPDSVAIAKLKVTQENTGTINGKPLGPENLTQTDKFSRELFSTIAATTESGSLDQATADQISSSLADKIQNSAPRKVFTVVDIKIINDDSIQAYKNYNNTMNSIDKKYPLKTGVMNVLQKFLADGNNVDAGALAGLDPIIKSTQGIISAAIKVSVPHSLVQLHLDSLNAMERVMENLSDIRLYDTDPVVALGGISQYDQNATTLNSSIIQLKNAIAQKLSN